MTDLIKLPGKQIDDFKHNRESWNELTALHAESSFYDVEGFKKGKTTLNPIEMEELGDIKGMKIEFFNEYPYQVYNCFPNLVEIEPGKWVLKKYGKKGPHMYSIKARKTSNTG